MVRGAEQAAEQPVVEGGHPDVGDGISIPGEVDQGGGDVGDLAHADLRR